jgi:hypothetical protein
MDDKTQRILRHVGNAAKPFTYSLRGKEGRGWRAPSRLDKQKEVEQGAAELRADDVRLYLGTGGTELFALPGVPALDVIEVAQVGTHNRSDGGWQEVREVVEHIAKRAEFDVIFADQAGFEGAFHKQADPSLAQAISGWLIEHDFIDSLAFMAEHAPDAMGEDPVVAYVARFNRFRLWWD